MMWGDEDPPRALWPWSGKEVFPGKTYPILRCGWCGTVLATVTTSDMAPPESTGICAKCDKDLMAHLHIHPRPA